MMFHSCYVGLYFLLIEGLNNIYFSFNKDNFFIVRPIITNIWPTLLYKIYEYT